VSGTEFVSERYRRHGVMSSVAESTAGWASKSTD